MVDEELDIHVYISIFVFPKPGVPVGVGQTTGSVLLIITVVLLIFWRRTKSTWVPSLAKDGFRQFGQTLQEVILRVISLFLKHYLLQALYVRPKSPISHLRMT
jgi:hypothetical protein